MKRAASLDKIRDLLLKRRGMIRNALVGELRHLNRNWDLRPVGDSGDDAQEGADDEIVSRMAQAESDELRAIEEALERMREGHYGLCEECGQTISTERLQALPYATMCIDCQRAQEPGGGRRSVAASPPKPRRSAGGAMPQREGEDELSPDQSER
jgi:DnaK suppressor protein